MRIKKFKAVWHGFYHYLLLFVFFLKKVVEKALYLSLFVEIKCIYFFTKTRLGYSLYLFALCVIYGTKTEEPGILFGVCLLLSGQVVGTTISMYVLVKTPLTRRYLQTLFGEDYLVKHLGPNMMSDSARKVVLGVFSVLIAEKVAEHWDRQVNNQVGDKLENSQKQVWQESGYTPSMQERQAIFDKGNEYRLKDPRGMSDQGFNLVRKILKAFGGE